MKEPDKKSGGEEYGMVGSATILKEASYRSMLAINGLHFPSTTSMVDIWKRLEKMVNAAIDSREENLAPRNLEELRGSMARAEEIVLSVSSKMGVVPPRIGWVMESPVRMAVYSPSHRTLIMHRFVADHMRVADVTILALHEVLGHAHQEAKTHGLPVPTSEAEWCAMKCESVAKKIMGTMRYAHEWRVFRLARAMVDMRLHCLPEMARSPESIWDSLNAKIGGSLSSFVPFKDETLRAAALPGQALTYVLTDSSLSGSHPRGCHDLCRE